MELYINDGGGGSDSQPTAERVAKELPGLVPSTPSPPCTNTTSIAAINAGIREKCGAHAWMNTGGREDDTASVSDVVIQIIDDEVLNETRNQRERCKDEPPTAQFSKRWSVINWVKSKFTRDQSTSPFHPPNGFENDVLRIFWIRKNANGTSAGKSREDRGGRTEHNQNAEWAPVLFNSNETLRLDNGEYKNNGDNSRSTAHDRSQKSQKHDWIEDTISETDPGASVGVLPMGSSEVLGRESGHSFFDTFTMKNIQRRIRGLGHHDSVKRQCRGESFTERENQLSGQEMPVIAGVSSSKEQNDIHDEIVVITDDRNSRNERSESSDPTVLRTDRIERDASGKRMTIGNVLVLRDNGTLTDDGILYNTFVIRENGQCEQQEITIVPWEKEVSVTGTENDSELEGSQNLCQAKPNNLSALNEGDVKIQKEDPESSDLSDSPIKVYMEAMYYLCASPIKLDGDSKSSSLLQKVLYIILTLVSTVYGLQLVKDHITLADREKQKLGFYVYLAFYVNGLLFPLYFKYLAHRKPDIFKDIACFRTRGWKRFIKVIVIFCIGSSIATAAYQPVSRMNYIFDIWDVEDMILVHSQRASYSVFIWNPSNVTNATAALNKQYGYGSEKVTPTIIGMGVVGMGIEVLGTTSLNLIRDIPLFCALTLLLRALDFVSLLRNATRGNVVNLLPHIWRKYNDLREFSLKIKRLNVLFQFLHLDNMLFFSYALYDRLIVGENRSPLIYQIIRGMKSVSFYLVAAKDACVNPTFRRWIQTTSRHTNVVFNVDTIPISGASVIEEINTDPIGVGSNMWFVDQSFVWKFFSYVGSSFFFFVESHDDDDDDD